MKKLNLNFWKFLLPMLVLAIGFSSCTKEDIDGTPTPTPVEEVDSEQVADIITKNEVGVFAFSSSSCDCYGPFDDIDWETASDEEIQAQVEAAIASMTEDELDALFTPVCTDDGGFYPNACFAECEGVTDFVECEFPIDDTNWDTDWGCDLDFLACYELVFPVTLAFADGTTTEVNSMDEYLEAILTMGNEPQLVYPIDLTNIETGEIATASNDDELAELAFDCISGGGPGWGGEPTWDDDCVIDNFPMTLYLNGDANTVNNEEEFATIIEDFINSNPSGNVSIEFGFPMTLTFDSGDVVVVNDEQEWMDAMEQYCP